MDHLTPDQVAHALNGMQQMLNVVRREFIELQVSRAVAGTIDEDVAVERIMLMFKETSE